MNVNKLVKSQVNKIADGALIALQDFAVPTSKKGALEKSLSDLYRAGVLQRITNGLYYKPTPSIFGILPPSTSTLLNKLLILYKNSIAYLTGIPTYTSMGLTTQVSTEYVIASDKPRRDPIVFGPTTIRFIPSYVKETVQDIHLLPILDAIRDINNIPATTPQKASVSLMMRIKRLTSKEQKELCRLAIFYPPSTRAFVGLIFETISKKRLANTLRNTLNPTSRYVLKINKDVFTSYHNWYIP